MPGVVSSVLADVLDALVMLPTLSSYEAGAGGVVGATVSSTKLLVPAVLVLPAASVAVALTLMVPLPKVVRSPLVSCTATSVAPEPVTVLLTVLTPLVNTTETVAFVSAATETTPPAAVASEAVAPLETPAPRVNTGALGAVVST